MRTKFYDPAPGEGGGGAPQLTLKELDELENKPDAPVITNTTPDPPGVVEGLNEDGTLKEGFEKNEAGEVIKSIVKDEPPKEEEKPEKGDEGDKGDETPPDEIDATEFYAQVDQITGEPVEVDFGEIDPLSPAGVAIRDKAVRDDANKKFDEYLRTSDPHSYAYMVHRRAGGTDEDFKKEESFALPAESEFYENADMQAAIVKQDLISKGVPTEVVEATVEKYIKDNLLTQKAKIAYDSRKASQEQQMLEIENRQKEIQDKINAQANQVLTSISKEITEGGLNLVIPETKKAGFNQFVKDNLRFDDGKFFLVSELGDNIKEMLEAQYFQYIKGDLTGMIRKEAKKQTVQRLRTAVNKNNTDIIKGGSAQKSTTEFIPLENI